MASETINKNFLILGIHNKFKKKTNTFHTLRIETGV